MAASNYTLPAPQPLEIHDPQAVEKWKKFKRAWKNYALANELSKKSEQIQVATLLTVIGEEAREVYATFTGWVNEGDATKIELVLAKFETYCKIFHLKDTDSTVVYRNLAKHMTSIALLCTSWLKVAILQQ